MCWTPPCTRHKTKANKTKCTTQYVLDATIHRTQDEGKQNKVHNGHNHTQTQDEGKQNKNKVLLFNGSDVFLYIKI